MTFKQNIEIFSIDPYSKGNIGKPTNSNKRSFD